MVLWRDKDGSYRINTSLNNGRYGTDILCDLTLAQALLVKRYVNGGTLTGGEKNEVDDIIENKECSSD